jgi:hypothetical protein
MPSALHSIVLTATSAALRKKDSEAVSKAQPLLEDA